MALSAKMEVDEGKKRTPLKGINIDAILLAIYSWVTDPWVQPTVDKTYLGENVCILNCVYLYVCLYVCVSVSLCVCKYKCIYTYVLDSYVNLTQAKFI